jgi:hypothetical protein
MKSLYLDCFCGASGDMIVGALIDAGASFEAIQRGLASLGVEELRVSIEKVNKHGIAATHFRVHLDHGHDHIHRHLSHVLDIIGRGDLPDNVKTASAETFRRIAECEAAIHNTTPEEVHFHEVGAVDSIADIVAAHLALHLLSIETVTSSPLHVGSGTVKCAHGILPVPAPATAALLKGAPVYGGEVQGELVTPTGAALVAQWAQSYGPMPEMRIEAIGYGSGTRDLPDRANVLRAIIGEVTPKQGMEPVTVVETNVDDMTPELLAPLVADLIAAGARDAFLTPIMGKKGRPGFLVTVLCDAARLSEVTRCLFHGSTTFGVRIREERRICLDRSWENVKTQWGEVRVKVGRLDGVRCSASPEFEDCRALAQQAGVPVLAVYRQALAAAIREYPNI